jgi:hypothetical protein
MTVINASAKNGPKPNSNGLPDELVIQGPKLPRRQVAIPEWIDPECLAAEEVWPPADQAKLEEAVAGSTPTGRELIQKAVWRIGKHPQAGKDAILGVVKRLLNPRELALLDRLLLKGDAEGAFIAENLWRVDYFRRPPSMEQFLTDPYFLGGS